MRFTLGRKQTLSSKELTVAWEVARSVPPEMRTRNLVTDIIDGEMIVDLRRSQAAPIDFGRGSVVVRDDAWSLNFTLDRSEVLPCLKTIIVNPQVARKSPAIFEKAYGVHPGELEPSVPREVVLTDEQIVYPLGRLAVFATELPDAALLLQETRQRLRNFAT